MLRLCLKLMISSDWEFPITPISTENVEQKPSTSAFNQKYVAGAQTSWS